MEDQASYHRGNVGVTEHRSEAPTSKRFIDMLSDQNAEFNLLAIQLHQKIDLITGVKERGDHPDPKEEKVELLSFVSALDYCLTQLDQNRRKLLSALERLTDFSG